jgi:hypothetical protein
MQNTRALYFLKAALLALLLASPVIMGLLYRPDVFIDDAYITFRYAENIAAGFGFTYNPGERVLGTTTPLYCLWLALWKLLGVPVSLAALLTGTLSVSFTALLIWRTGKTTAFSHSGLAAAFLLLLFPRYYEHMISGMETTLAGALCMLVIWLDFKKKHIFCGVASACLILTRPDAGALVAAVILIRFLNDRKGALIIAAVTLLGILPWAVFGFIYFGSPLPTSLAVKRLIHPFPWHLVLKNYLSWFIIEPALIILSALWLAGAFFIILRRRDLLALFLWPLFFFAGQAAIQIGPFFWYKVPLLPGYFLVAAVGGWYLLSAMIPDRRKKWRLRGLAILTAIIILCALAVVPFRHIRGRELKILYTDKELIYKEIAEEIMKRGDPGDSVYVGDVGVLGYYLKDFHIIDSSGLNSPEVYRIRLQDRMKLLRHYPEKGFDWWGSPEWSRKIIQEMKPDFITSDIRYLHLRTLAREEWFQNDYRFIQSWSEGRNQYLLFQKANIQEG